jgi:ATP-binding cassette subfamily F protein 3
VQSRIKQLEKIEVIEVEEEDFTSIHFHFPEPPRSGRVAVEMEKLTKSYGDKLVLDKIHFAVERGEKVAFIGKNGEGKSTLSKIIAGIESYEGDMKLGHNVYLGYFAQHQAEMLDGDATVLETIDNAATGDIRTQIRSLLGAFLFSGDSVYKKVRVLSGGEKSRLALAKLLLAPTNLIVMDEPTNHLDMMAKGVLKKALINYQGALIIVSHDRDFLKGLTTKSVEFKNQGIREYPGDIEEYLAKQQIATLDEVQSDQPAGIEDDKPEPVKQAKLDREKQKAIQREENKVRRMINLCEEEIHALETKITEYDSFFASPEYYNNHDKYPQKKEEYSQLRKNLETRMEEWEQLNLQLEAIK